MAANRFGLPTPQPPGEDHSACPVCGWNPCTSLCKLGLMGWEVSDLSQRFEDGPEGLYYDGESDGFSVPDEYEGEDL